MPKEGLTNRVVENSNIEEIPPLYIDTQYLKPVNTPGESYVIDNIVFKDQLLDIQRYRRFNVFKIQSGSMAQYDVCVDEDTSSEGRELQVSVRSAPHGLVINEDVFLTRRQWNTLLRTDRGSLWCAVCGEEVEEVEEGSVGGERGARDEGGDHCASAEHARRLQRHPPLEQFELAITRQIGSNYHCGVCSELFSKGDVAEHFSGQSHRDNMLFAVNKVSDLAPHAHQHARHTDTYHYNAKAINNFNDSNSDDDGYDFEDYRTDNDNNYNENDDCSNGRPEFVEYDNNYEDFLMDRATSYASMTKKPKLVETPSVLEIDLGVKKVTVNFDSWHMVIKSKLNYFYCMVCKDSYPMRKKYIHCQNAVHLKMLNGFKVVEAYEKYLVRQLDDKLYHCGHCNNLQLIHDMQDHIAAMHPKPAPDKAHKNTAERVNTAVQCQQEDNTAPSTPDKQLSDEHRAVEDKNINKEDALNIQAKQNAEVSNSVTEQDVSNANIERDLGQNIHKDLHGQNADKGLVGPNIDRASIGQNINTNLTVQNMHSLLGLNLQYSNINENVIINPFGYNMVVSKLAYNIVCERPGDYYCGLCEWACPKPFICGHVADYRHVLRLQRTPFIFQFQCNLIRPIRDALHCTVCNVPVVPLDIHTHILENNHNARVRTALGLQGAPAQDGAGPGGVAAPASRHAEELDAKKQCIDINSAKVNVIEVPSTGTETTKDAKVEHSLDGSANNDISDVSNDSVATEDTEFDFEEHVYIKIGTSYSKISNGSYNTLVCVGDGGRYCFACAAPLAGPRARAHADTRAHRDNIDKCKFIDKYKDDLIRQMYLLYHCSICNTLMSRRDVRRHVTWPTHALLAEDTRTDSKQRRNEIKSGTKQHTFATQKENIYLKEKEPKRKIILYATLVKELADNVAPEEGVPVVENNLSNAAVTGNNLDTLENDNATVDTDERKNKIVIFKDNVFKIDFYSWHGLVEAEGGYKCKLCGVQLAGEGGERGEAGGGEGGERGEGGEAVRAHVRGARHAGALRGMLREHAPALIRKVSETTLHCVMCNTEVSNTAHVVREHAAGRRHAASCELVRRRSAAARCYEDCDPDVVTID